jgi:hypothetical protein
MRITGPVEASMVNTALSTPMRRVGNGTRPSQSICRARTEAVRERLDRVRQARGISLADQLLTIGKDCAAHLKKPFRTIDHDVIWPQPSLFPRWRVRRDLALPVVELKAVRQINDLRR